MTIVVKIKIVVKNKLINNQYRLQYKISFVYKKKEILLKKEAIVILGGGSAKGLAHIGALEIIEKHYEIKGILGTSMGSIIGGLYAAGKSPTEIKKIFKGYKLLDYLSIISFPFPHNGFVSSQKFEEMIFEKIGNIHIEDLKIPFVAVAYNLSKHQTVLINKGKLKFAMQASSSIPIVFSPFKSEGDFFIDGGIEYPLAVPFKNIFGDYFSIAVNVLQPIPIVPVFHEIKEKDKSKFFEENNLKEGLKSITDNQAFLASKSATVYQPDILINAHLPNVNSWEFMKVDEFYERGKYAAQKTFDKLKTENKSFTNLLTEKYEQLKEKIGKIKIKYP